MISQRSGKILVVQFRVDTSSIGYCTAVDREVATMLQHVSRTLAAGLAGCHNISAVVSISRGFVTSDSPDARAAKVVQAMGIARSRDLERAGVSRTQLRRLVESGRIERVGRGLYSLPDVGRSEQSDLAEAARRVPGGVVCLLSALRFHGLTTQNPFEVWMAIDRKAWRPRIEHPPLRLVYLSGSTLEAGIEEHDADGVTIRVFSAAKTIADCFKFRNKIGTDVAVEGLRDYRRQYPKKLDAVWRYAEVNRVGRIIRPYLESLE
jgi:predicted transcriptional regulator of viral defense system